MKRGLARLLTEQGRKKQWLAASTGVSPKTISRYLSGETTPPSDWVKAAARVLGCDPQDITEQSKKVAPAPQQGTERDANTKVYSGARGLSQLNGRGGAA